MARQRTFTDEALIEQLPLARSWNDLVNRLAGTDAVPHVRTVKDRVEALQLDTSHISFAGRRAKPAPSVAGCDSGLEHGGPLAGALWYEMHGLRATLAAERARYDLLVEDGPRILRVQVKSTRHRTPSGAYHVALTTTRYDATREQHTAAGKRRQMRYLEGEVDEFFIVTADGRLFRIPWAETDGQSTICLPGRFDRCEVFWYFPDAS